MACALDLFPHTTTVDTGSPIIVGDDPLADDDLATYVDITTGGAGGDDACNSVYDLLPSALAADVIDATLNIVATVTEPGGSSAQPLLMHYNNAYFIAMHTFGSHLSLPQGAAVLTQFPVTASHLALEGLTPADLADVLMEPARLIIRGDSSAPGPMFRVHRAWLTVNYNCLSTITHAPPLRQYPRSDGLGASSARRMWPPPRSIQGSNRQGPGAHL